MILAGGGCVLAALMMVGQHRVGAQAGAAAAQSTPPTVDTVFKNVQALKGLSVDDFMLTMGIMSAAVGSDCVGCHPSAGMDRVDWAVDNSPWAYFSASPVFAASIACCEACCTCSGGF